MAEVQDTLHVNVEYSTEDKEYSPVYVATADEIALVTDGDTFEEMLANLREALAGCLEDTDTVKDFNLVPNPRAVLIMEMPEPYKELRIDFHTE